MLNKDAYRKQQFTLKNLNSINVEAISEIQRELDPYDLISLVFLLYDVPDTALQRLIVFQRVCRGNDENNINLLYDWALYAQSRSTWKYEFIEALAICQLYGIIRKLGYNISEVKKHFLPSSMHTNIYIDPIKKALYKFCENVDSDSLTKLQKALLTYDINTMEYEYCEQILLELMSQNFIIVNQITSNSNQGHDYQLEKLIRIIDKIPVLKRFAEDLKDIENRFNPKSNYHLASSTHMTSFYTPIGSVEVNPSMPSALVDTNADKLESKSDGSKYTDGFEDIYKLIGDLNLDNSGFLKPDKNRNDDVYVIKNPERLGVCCIINQEVFYPSKNSIENDDIPVLDDRIGSSNDEMILKDTMTKLKFNVVCYQNLGYHEIFDTLKDVVQNKFLLDDSVFMLCILSHGIRDHIYAADSTKVKVEDIQSFLDSNEAKTIHDIPKVIIIQACQTDSERVVSKMIADKPKSKYYIKKSEFLTFWATVPEYEAYRYGTSGSIFINVLCKILLNNVKTEHLKDIFTKVSHVVKVICTRLKVNQMPILNSTWTKKLYLSHFISHE